MVSNSIQFSLRVLVTLVALLGSLVGSLPVGMYAVRPAVTLGASAGLAPDEAVVAAVNDWDATADGWQLRHPRHTATFTPAGVEFAPRSGGPEWTWRLTFVGAAGVSVDAVPPQRDPAGGVAYHRGGLVEQYLARKNTIEQQFLIPQPLALNGMDLVIAGAVVCAGAFEETADGWLWRTADGAAASGAVHLGNVRVYDAAGRELPATMAVTAAETRIVVAGAALTQAAYPVTIDPELGANDLRISFMGKDIWYNAFNTAVAYNSTDDEYLVVWYADDNSGTLADDEFEIYAQRVDAATGALIGANFRLSDMGGTGNADYDAYNPAVAYDSTDNQYLVVWEGDDNTAPLVDGEYEIFGQRLSSTGSGVGTNDFRISDMGPDGDANYDAIRPAVAYNSTANEYLVVWQGDDDAGSLVDEENEIFAQRLNAATGAEVGTNDFRLSDMGGVGDANYDAYAPAVAYNSADNEYLAVWAGDDTTPGDNETEIFGQLLTATGGGTGSNDFRISDMGPDGNTSYAAHFPDVAYNSTDNQYLVVWYGDDDTGDLVNEEFEIYGQRLTAAGASTGTNDFRISSMGPDGDIAYRAEYPAVTYNRASNQYLVVWHGVDNTAPLVAGEQEILGQRLTATGSGTGANDFRISDMGGNGNNGYGANRPAVAYNGTGNEYLVVWHGDDDIAPLTYDEDEIFGQRLNSTGVEVAPNDFRLSFMGEDELANAYDPAVAYNSQDDEYLVVWEGDDGTAPLVNNEYEIWGQRVDAATGALIGAAIRISDMGPNGNANYGAYSPAVAYNSADNQYLVVWQGDDDTGALVDGEIEIYGQRINAATGVEVGTNDFRVSDMGPDGDTAYGAFGPAVAYNSLGNQYLVVWYGDDDAGSLVDGEYEIFGQRLSATGGAVGTNDFRISDMGPDGDVNYDALDPAVAYNSTDDEYLVVWEGDDNNAGFVDNEFEIFGQRLTAAGAGTGDNDFCLSDMGPNTSTLYSAYNPAVAYNSADNEYLVVWEGDDDTGSLVDNEYEIYGQRLTASGSAVGTNDFRISDMGPNGDVAYDATNPAVAYDSQDNEYLVVWEGDDDTAPLVDEEYEIFGQRLSAAGASMGDNDFRLSDMGSNGNTAYSASYPKVAYSSVSREYLGVWYGDDNTLPLVDGELEIFGQRFTGSYRLYLPVVLRN